MNHKNVTNDLIFPENTSEEYTVFVNGLLTDSKSRLNHTKIMSHELFQDVIWDKLREQVNFIIFVYYLYVIFTSFNFLKGTTFRADC